MKVLWTHNFDPKKPNAGCFMYEAARGLVNEGIKLDIEYLGNLKNPINILRAQNRISAISKSYDLVHAQYGSACALVTSASKVPKVCTIRGSDWNLYSESLNSHWLHTRLARAMTKQALGWYNLVICVSHRLAGEITMFCKPKYGIAVHPSPIDLKKWHIKKNNKKKKGFYRVLFTSNNQNNPVKRIWLLEKALPFAESCIGPVQVIWATGLKKDQMPKIVASCDAVACTSVSEGWPNSVKEALACNVPFVSTDVSDLKMISKREPSCRIAKNNPHDFAKALCKVLLYKKSTNLKKHITHLDLKQSSKQLVTLYKKTLQF